MTTRSGNAPATCARAKWAPGAPVRWAGVTGALASVLLTLASSVALADRRRDCEQEGNSDLAVQACGELIAKDARDSAAYLSRGSAYALKGEAIRAQADFAEADRLARSEGGRPNAVSPPEQATASPWVKLCEPVNVGGADRAICVTTHERIDGATGMVLVSAALRHVEGESAHTLMALVPEGMRLPPGLHVLIYPKEDWDKVQKGDIVEQSRARTIKLAYTLCQRGGCAAEGDASPEVVAALKAGGGFVVMPVSAANKVVALSVPLAGFAEAYEGPPADNAEYAQIRTALMKQIEDRKRAGNR